MADVFLSYSRRDRSLAQQLVETLSRLGVTVWWDEAIAPGERWRDAISDALSGAEAAILLITPASLASPSARAEWQQAIASTKRVLPVLAGDAEYADLPPEVRHIQALRLPGERLDAPIGNSVALAALVDWLGWSKASRPGQDRRDRRLDYLANPFPEIRERVVAARYQVDLAADSLDGLFQPLPQMLGEALTAGVRIRVVLPDPDYFADPAGGRNLEVAAKSRIAVDQLRDSNLGVAVRLLAQPIVQSMLRVDDDWFIDPFPVSTDVDGYLRIRRHQAAAELFAILSNAFEALFMSGRPLLPPSEREVFRPTAQGLLESRDEWELERAAQAYFSKLGYEAASNARMRGAEFDLLLWDPSGGGPAVVEVKRTRKPISAASIDQLISSARHLGAGQAFLVTDEPITASASQRLGEALAMGLKIDVVTSDVIRESLAANTK